jgi:hypothetical protein
MSFGGVNTSIDILKVVGSPSASRVILVSEET